MSLQHQDNTIDQIRQIFIQGVIDITGDIELAAKFAHLKMTYTTGNDRYVLDTINRLTSLLDYTTAIVADGCVDIELDINPLYFKDNLNAYDPCNISFASFTECMTI